MLCSLSNLNDQTLDKIKALEDEIGTPVLAFSCHSNQTAILDADKLAKLQDAEKQLGLSLIAVSNA